MRVSDELAAAELRDTDDRPRAMRELWRDRPALVLWVRHFGWTFCQEQVAELRPHVDELRASGVEPYVIGSGTPAEARDFQRHVHAENVPVLVDQALASYAAAGWKRSMGATLHPSSWLHGIKSMIAHPQRKTAGDPWQLGGAMIVRPDGEVTWSFRSETGGDHPKIATLVDEARKAVAA